MKSDCIWREGGGELARKFLTRCLTKIGNSSSHLLCAVPCQMHTPHSNLILATSLYSRHYCPTHFTGEEKEAKRALVNILRSQMSK